MGGSGAVVEDPAAAILAHAATVAGEALVAVVLHGSVARREATAASDADVLIVVETRVALNRDLYRAWDAQPVAWRGRHVDPHFVHPPADDARSGLWAEAALDGVVLFERDLRLSSCLARLRRSMGRRSSRAARRSRPAVLDGGRLMRNRALAADYVHRAGVRLRTLDVLYDAESWADVVRESQEVVELALKGLLRAAGIDPPRVHDVADVISAERNRLPGTLSDDDVDRLGAASRDLRRDRELAFYGAEGPDPVGLLPAGRRCQGAGGGAARGRVRPPTRSAEVTGLPRHDEEHRNHDDGRAAQRPGRQRLVGHEVAQQQGDHGIHVGVGGRLGGRPWP